MAEPLGKEKQPKTLEEILDLSNYPTLTPEEEEEMNKIIDDFLLYNT